MPPVLHRQAEAGRLPCRAERFNKRYGARKPAGKDAPEATSGVTDVDQSGRRSRLRSVKLQALVRDHLSHDLDATPGTFPPVAITADGGAWVLAEDDPGRAPAVGPGVGACATGPRALDVLAERETGTRPAGAGIRFPIEVWHVAERTLLPALVAPLEPTRLRRPSTSRLVDTDRRRRGRASSSSTGSSPARCGLEVCRARRRRSPRGAVRLEVGVGAHDREAFTISTATCPASRRWPGVVRAVEEHRGPAPPSTR